MKDVYGFLHCHSEHSLKDSAMSIKELVDTACSMEADAVSLTDHGTMTGIVEFMQICKRKGIKGIPGIEAYIKDESGRRCHLILLAKNYTGLQEIYRAVARSNKNIETNKSSKTNYPLMTDDIIEDCFGNGNVIATSACVNGELGTILLQNDVLSKKIEKLKDKQAAYPYQEISSFSASDAELDNLISTRDHLAAIASKKYTKRLKALTLYSGEEYATKKTELDKEIQESEEAKLLLMQVKADIKKARANSTKLSKKRKEQKAINDKYSEYQIKIDSLYKQIKTDKELLEECGLRLSFYKAVFGRDFFIELQYHGMSDEAYVMPILAEFAREYDIPVVATNDVHMAKKDDYKARQFMKSLRFNKWEEIDYTEKELYMKTDAELRTSLLGILNEEVVETAIKNIRFISTVCNVEIPNKKHYPTYRDDNGVPTSDAGNLLEEKARAGITLFYPNDTFTPLHETRLNTELETIINMGFADYLLIVADIIAYANTVAKRKYGLGYGVGPGRGSAAGSLICQLLGITKIDPILYNLKFERFLNVNRITMPDIDIDLSDEVRSEVIEFVKRKFGESCVALIRTKGTQGARDTLRNSARLMGHKQHGNPKHYKDIANTLAKCIPLKPGAKILENLTALKSVTDTNEKYEIIESALAVENTMTEVGVHAAGIVVSDGNPLTDYVPVMYNTDLEQWVAQCDMVEVEDMGLLKIDLLGLRNLDIITETIRNIYKHTGKIIDPDNIPYDKDVYDNIFASGNTRCVFQLESANMRNTLMSFKPRTFEDIILIIAAYRPGPMEFIPDIIRVKNGEKTPDYCVPELEPILSPTYGYPIYQEQLIDIFATCAGFTQAEADIIRRYMSKKKVDKFMEAKPKFIDGLMEHGANKESAEAFWESLVDFSKYAFNKSHAAAYAYLAYITGYLKYHYPMYYMCACLNHPGDKNPIASILHACAEIGVKVLMPDINKSESDFTCTEEGILYGLSGIKSVKNAAVKIVETRKLHGGYSSFKDFKRRSGANKAVCEALINGGAFDRFEEGTRRAYLEINTSLATLLKNIADKEKQLIAESEKKTEGLSATEKKTLSLKIEKLTGELSVLNKEYAKCETDRFIEDDIDTLNREYNVLGAFISRHPLDAYSKFYKKAELSLICDISTDSGTYLGIVTDLKIIRRKSDDREMAFFTLSDTSGSINCICHSKRYEDVKELLTENAVLMVKGYGTEDERYDEDGVLKLNIRSVQTCKPEKSPIYVSIPDIRYEKYAYDTLVQFSDEEGYPIWLHLQNTGEISKKNLSVSRKVLSQGFPHLYIQFLQI